MSLALQQPAPVCPAAGREADVCAVNSGRLQGQAAPVPAALPLEQPQAELPRVTAAAA